MNRVLMLGATSLIAQETARLYAARGDALYLAARNPDRLKAVAADCRVRGASVVFVDAKDLAEIAAHRQLVDNAAAAMDGIDIAILAYGEGASEESKHDVAAAERIIRTNFTSAASLLTLIADRMEARGSGTIAVITSVAGDRGRQSNYVYGAAKGALTLFLQGLRNRLHPSGVAVVTIKPGFVDTPMTESLRKSALFASAKEVALGIREAIAERKDEVYLPGFWRPVMAAIGLIPEGVFKRMKL